MLVATKMHVVASLEQHIGYHVHVKLSISIYKVMLFLYNQFMHFGKSYTLKSMRSLLKYFSTLDIFAERVLTKKVLKLAHSSIISMCSPLIKY